MFSSKCNPPSFQTCKNILAAQQCQRKYFWHWRKFFNRIPSFYKTMGGKLIFFLQNFQAADTRHAKTSQQPSSASGNISGIGGKFSKGSRCFERISLEGRGKFNEYFFDVLIAFLFTKKSLQFIRKKGFIENIFKIYSEIYTFRQYKNVKNRALCGGNCNPKYLLAETL